MANCCIADISLFRKDGVDFSDEETLAIKEVLCKLDHCGSGDITYEDGNIIEWHGDTRWAIPEEELQEVAKQFNSRIRAVGREDGCAFVQVVCIDQDGDIVQSDAINFAF